MTFEYQIEKSYLRSIIFVLSMLAHKKVARYYYRSSVRASKLNIIKSKLNHKTDQVRHKQKSTQTFAGKRMIICRYESMKSLSRSATHRAIFSLKRELYSLYPIS